MPRTLIREDGITRLYEVTDDEGNVIGTDEEMVDPPTTLPVGPDQIIASIADMTPAQKADLRAALGL